MKLPAQYLNARRALAALTHVREVKGVRDKAMAVEAYARQAKDYELAEQAVEVRFRAEIRAGELLREMKARGERQSQSQPKKLKSPTATLIPKLADLGVTKTQASRWQTLAALPADEQEVRCERTKKKVRSALDGTAKQERAEMRAADEARVRSLQPIDGRFRTLVIDPPWDYEWLSLAGRASPGYATMTHEELLALPVAAWAEDNCHLYLWTTNNFLTRAVELMAHWGFQHKTVLTWVKPRWGLGSYFRNSTEHVLFGVRGELRTRSDSIATHFEAPLGDHSEKPERFYEIVRQASYEPYGEAFQRETRPDFASLFAVREAAE